MLDYSYIGSGKVYMREVGAAAPLAEVGNVSDLTLSPQEDTKELLDKTSPGGGTYNEVRRITGVDMAVTMHDVSPANLSRALYGSSTATIAGSVTGESVTGYNDGLNRLAHGGVQAVTKVTDSTATTTYVEGTDYETRPSGIFILAGGNITDGETLLVDYDYVASDVIEALTTSGKEYELVFEGLNEARSDKQAILDCYRWRPGPAQNISMIGDDYAALTITGKLLKDTSKTGTGISQYFRAELVQ